MKHRIVARWTKWRSAFGLLCDHKMPFLYLGLIIHKDGENEEDVNHSIISRWMK